MHRYSLVIRHGHSDVCIADTIIRAGRRLKLVSVVPSLVWLREDLRLTDNPAVAAASAGGRPVSFLYILDEMTPGLRPIGGAARWWLDKSLKSLGKEIARRGGRLTLRAGPAADVIDDVISQTGAGSVYWNRAYDAGGRARDSAIKASLKTRGLVAESFNGRLLAEPWEIKTGAGGWFKVFTPFWRALQAQYTAAPPLPSPSSLRSPEIASEDITTWRLHPSKPDWSTGFSDHWTPGEAGAASRLEAFLAGPVNTYGEDRNRPDIDGGTSGLSPHLRFGEISPAQIWRSVTAAIERGAVNEKSARVFLSEVGWREFSYVLLFHNQNLANENYNKTFDAMPWRTDTAALAAWQQGQTGYPIVDAGMRQLWHTGWMHNRVRMIVASFLTKHLLLPWQSGEDWFWDTLVDADAAANAASWQWTAGSGADAAPYFRVFNPITQGEKFDETGAYVRRWCPELAGLPAKVLHSPWSADAATLETAGIRLGETYPHPIVDHAAGRQRALDAYAFIKSKQVSE